MRAGTRIDEGTFDEIRRTMALEHFKWDAQVGDVDALAPFALVLAEREWSELAHAAEALTREMFAAEGRVLADARAREQLGVPRAIRPLLERLADDPTPAVGRIVRFDFHPTPAGWRISEANSDVPGGFTESSTFTAMMAEAVGGRSTGDPARVWLDAIARRSESVALMIAPGWLEDAQVVAYLARGLQERGCRAVIVDPQQLRWIDGVAHAGSAVDAIVRFHQVEWLAQLPRKLGWSHFFTGGKTRVANPGIAIVSESKRFPIACRHAGLAMPSWDALLPETVDPRERGHSEEWLLKGTFGNTGETVAIRSDMTATDWRRCALSARIFPHRWIAQRRFESSPLETPDGERHVCLGVYTIDGVAAGAYARLSQRTTIHFAAVDTAVLVEGA